MTPIARGAPRLTGWPSLSPPARLFLLSLAVRLAFLIPVVAADVPPLFDENVYFDRAVAVARAGKAALAGHVPSPTDLDTAYARGVWPPLHALVLAVPIALFGESVAVARCAVALISAVTTILVFRLTSRLFSRRAGWAAGLAHACYPGFVGYSHLLWSETTYILLLLATLDLALCVADEPTARRAPLRAIGCGAALGASLLTRAAGVPYLIVVPILILLRPTVRARGSRILAAVLVAAAAIAVIAPWEAVLARREGRPVLLSTAGAYNVFLGNNAWLGSADPQETKSNVRSAIGSYVRDHAISRDAAALRLAVDYAAHHPLRFAGGLRLKFCSLWTADDFLLRHVLWAIYPPLPLPIFALLWGAIVIGFLALASLGVCGLVFSFRERGARLLALLIAAGMIPPLLSLANSRMALPLLALLCPAAGRGLESLLPAPRESPGRAHPSRAAALTWACGVAALLALNVATLAREPARAPRGSSWYAPAVAPVARRLGWNVRFTDLVSLRAVGALHPDAVRVTLADDHHVFREGSLPPPDWRPTVADSVLSFEVVSLGSETPITLEVLCEPGGARALVQPVSPRSWRRWVPTTIPGLEVGWFGSARGGGHDAQGE